MFSKRLKGQWLGQWALALALATPMAGWATVARMQTTLGVIDVRLYDKQAPITVENFLKYVTSGRYNNSIFHRSIAGFIVQGGGVYIDSTTGRGTYIISYGQIKNEYSATRSNKPGTIAMAKVDPSQGGGPDSATSQWFFNLADNSANLDHQNGGFTVFGKVVGAGMTTIKAIAALPKPAPNLQALLAGVFSDTPLLEGTTNNLPTLAPIMLNQVSTAAPASTSDADRVFGYLEGKLPKNFAPANPLFPVAGVSKTGSGFYYRYYAGTKKYLATANGKVYWGAALNQSMTQIGVLGKLLADAAKLGY